MTDDISPGTGPDDEALDPWSAHLSGLLDDPALWAEPSPEVEDQVLAAIMAGAAARPAPRPDRPPPLQPEPSPGPFSPDLTVVAPFPAPLSAQPPADQPAQPDRFDPSVTGVLPPDITGGFNPAGSINPGGGAPVVSLDAARRRRRPGGWLLGGLATAAAVAIIAVGALAVVTRDGGVSGTRVELAGSELAPDASAVATLQPQDDGVRILLDVTGLPPAPPGSFYAAWVVKEEPRTRIPIGSFHLRGGGVDQIELWSGVSTDDYRIVSVTRQSEADPAGPGEPMLHGRLGG